MMPGVSRSTKATIDAILGRLGAGAGHYHDDFDEDPEAALGTMHLDAKVNEGSKRTAGIVQAQENRRTCGIQPSANNEDGLRDNNGGNNFLDIGNDVLDEHGHVGGHDTPPSPH